MFVTDVVPRVNSSWLLRSMVPLWLFSACISKPAPDDDLWEDDDLWGSGLNNHITRDNKAIPDSLQRVEQYSNGVLFNVVEYDEQHRLIFRYYKQDWGETMPGRYGTMLAAYVYHGDRLAKSYYLHSNTNWSVNYYDYHWLGTRIKCYSRVNTYDKHSGQANTNPFRYVEKITSYQALLNHPKVVELDQRDKSQLSKEAVYGLSSHIQEELGYDGKGSIDSHTAYSYNEHGLLIRTLYQEDKPVYVRQFMREYNAQKLLAKEYMVTDGTDTSGFKQYWYDKAGRLGTAMQLVEKGENSALSPQPYTVFDKLVLRYDEHNALHQVAGYKVTKGGSCASKCEEVPESLITFFRNKEGFLVEQREADYIDDTVKVTSYNYVYRGYNTQK